MLAYVCVSLVSGIANLSSLYEELAMTDYIALCMHVCVAILVYTDIGMIGIGNWLPIV